VYEQQGNSMQLFADRSTDWRIFGWEMPSTWFQAFNSFFIFALGPLLNILWASQSKKGTEPDSITKMALGCVFLGASFLPLAWVVYGMGDTDKISFLWLAGCTVLYTLGEMYLSPIGLSLVTKVAPARIVSMMMGVWFLSSFFGNYMAGYFGTYYDKMAHSTYFLALMIMGLVAGAAIFAVRKPLAEAVRRSN
jgi:POT family proton-dependent oligopeptide transporter